MTLESLSVYWNTDTKSLAGMHHEEAAEVFTEMASVFLFIYLRFTNKIKFRFLLPLIYTGTINIYFDPFQEQAKSN